MRIIFFQVPFFFQIFEATDVSLYASMCIFFLHGSFNINIYLLKIMKIENYEKMRERKFFLKYIHLLKLNQLYAIHFFVTLQSKEIIDCPSRNKILCIIVYIS